MIVYKTREAKDIHPELRFILECMQASGRKYSAHVHDDASVTVTCPDGTYIFLGQKSTLRATAR